LIIHLRRGYVHILHALPPNVNVFLYQNFGRLPC